MSAWAIGGGPLAGLAAGLLLFDKPSPLLEALPWKEVPGESPLKFRGSPPAIGPHKAWHDE